MVPHLGLRTHEIFYEKIGNIIAEILSVRGKAECYEEVANQFQRNFTLIIIHRNFHTDLSLVRIVK